MTEVTPPHDLLSLEAEFRRLADVAAETAWADGTSDYEMAGYSGESNAFTQAADLLAQYRARVREIAEGQPLAEVE